MRSLAKVIRFPIGKRKPGRPKKYITPQTFVDIMVVAVGVEVAVIIEWSFKALVALIF